MLASVMLQKTPTLLWTLELCAFALPGSGVGWDQTCGQAAPDRGEPRAPEEGGDGADAADEAGAGRSGVGAHQDGDRGAPAHQRPGLLLETEAQVPGKQQWKHYCPWMSHSLTWICRSHMLSSVDITSNRDLWVWRHLKLPTVIFICN